MRGKVWRILFFARLFSPAGFAQRAAVLAALYLAVHALGFRESTSIICGTAPASGRFDFASVFPAMAYIVLYVLAVLAVPVLLIASAIFAAALAVFRVRPVDSSRAG